MTTIPRADHGDSTATLQAEITELQRRLDEAEETINAIRQGAVDAFVVTGPQGEQVYTLEGADRAYRVMVQCMQEGALVLTDDGTILFCNQRFADLLAMPHERLGGVALEAFISDNQVSALERLLADGSHRAARSELWLECADGRRVPTNFTVSPLPLGASATLCAVVSDLTEQKQFEELRRTQHALRESEERFRALFEQAAVGMAEIDLDTHRFARSNPAFRSLTGYSADELRSLSPLDLVHPDDRASDEEAWRLVLNGTEPMLRRETRYLRPDGQSLSVDSSVAVLRDERGVPLRALEAVADVTERRRAEALLLEADRRKDEFLATLAHELRNPLAPVRNAVQFLKLKRSNDREIDWARDVIDRQIYQMTRLVDDLLDLSRITHNQITLRREQVPLSQVIQSAVETSAPLVSHAGHRLTVTLPEDPVFLDADLTRLAQVFSNLLNNAAKYTDDGGEISVTAERDGPDVIVTVRDNGVGIPAEHLPHVFDMFTQVDRTLTRSQGGLGIGLTLVKGLVAMHGGRIDARSAGPGSGSEFIVRLPTSASVPTEGPSMHEQATPARRCRILIVDDNHDGADSLDAILTLHGHQVRTVYDGTTALSAVEAFAPDVVLLDLGMPKLDGYETCQLIRKTEHGKSAAVIALTGWSQPRDRGRTKQAGFDAHLVKPVDPAVLMNLLLTLTNGRGQV